MDLRIRVGASADRSLALAYQPLIQAAEKAKAAIESTSKRQARTYATEAKRGTDTAAREYARAAKEIERWEREKVRAVERSGRERARADERIAKEGVRATARAAAERVAIEKRAAADIARAYERSARQQSTMEARRASRQDGSIRADRMRDLGRYERRTHQGVVGAAGIIGGLAGRGIGAAAGILGSIAHGAGVNSDLGDIFHRNSELETGTTALSNASLINGDKNNGTRIDPRALMEQVLQTSAKTGTDANTTLEGLRKFVDLTGDLKTGRAVLQDLEMLAKATGTSMEDMVAAAGEISLALGPTEDKAGKITHLMKQFAAQGEMGAISIRSLASNMAKIAASAGQFEGDRSKNIAFLGVIGQEARRGGGAASASQSATAVAAFVNTLKTPKRAAEFEKATGMSTINKETGMMRDPEQLLMAALRAKGMDPLAFKKIFSSTKGAQGPEALATIFRTAGGGAAGERAVTEELDKLKKALIDDEQILESFHASMATAESQAQVFNNGVRLAAMKVQDALIPAMAELAPKFVDLANTTANVITWLVGEEARLRASQNAVNTQVNGATSATRQQTARGYILSGQQGRDDAAEKQAWFALNKAKADVATYGQEDRYSGTTKAMMKAADYVNPVNLFQRYMGWQSFGSKAVDQNEEKVQGRYDRLHEAQDSYDKIVKSNELVRDWLRDGIIKVRIEEDNTKRGDAPPGIDPAGRMPPPGNTAPGSL